MDKKELFKEIMSEFELWWENDPHSSNMDFYKKTITYSHLQSLSDKNFIDFFYEFTNDGGLVQSGGSRSKNQFRNTMENNINKFRKFILLPFEKEFSLEDWFLQIENFPYFGVGIATIFLNRVDYTKYPVMNNKTLTALNKLGYKISSSKTWNNYKLVKKYQANLLHDYPNLQNYFKADALNHFIVAVYSGQELISEYKQEVNNLNDELEQNEILIRNENWSKLSKQRLHDKITENENDKAEIVELKGKKYKRYNYLMAQIKVYRNYTCQFCSTKIQKANGGFYIEACHITPKAEGGKDSLDNILILCPNCHKLFDYGKRINATHSQTSYSVTINGKKYQASLK